MRNKGHKRKKKREDVKERKNRAGSNKRNLNSMKLRMLTAKIQIFSPVSAVYKRNVSTKDRTYKQK